VFAGKVPFPRDLVLRHAAWTGLQQGHPLQTFPEIGDLVTSFYPFHSIASRAWSEGTLPLWNPYILSGAPFVGNIQSALFYPFNFAYYVLSTPAAWAVCLIVRMFLAAWFMGLLVREIGGSKTGALFAGVVFATCGFMTAWQGQAMADAAMWLPMICYAIYRLHLNRSRRNFALLAFCFAMPVLAGHPETAFHLTVTASAWMLFLWAFPFDANVRPFDVRFLLLFGAAGVLAIGLTSVQLIPGSEWAAQPGWSYDFATPALSWHDGQGFFSRDMRQNLNSAGIGIPEAAAYVGMLTLLTAPFAFFHERRRLAVFMTFITVVATSIAFSVQPTSWIVSHLPYIKVMKHGRLILVASFGLAALAGLGISSLETRLEVVRNRRNIALALLAGTVLLSVVAIYKLHLATLSPVPFSKGPGASMVFLCVALLVLLWRIAAGVAYDRAFSIAALGLICVEMVSFSYGYIGFAQPSEIFPATPVFDFLRAHAEPGHFRFAKAGYPIPANAGVMYGTEAADGYEICLLATRTFCRDLTQDRDDAVFFLPDRIVQNRDRRVDLLNVKYFLVTSPSPEDTDFRRRPERFQQAYKDDGVIVYENLSVLPRLFAVPQSGIELIEDRGRQLERMKDPAFDPERNVVFGARPSGVSLNVSSDNPAITLLTHNANSSTFRIRAAQPSVLILSQIYYKGWKASIDGAETPIYQADYALTGVVAPAGDHQVRFFFDPQSVKIGAALSLMSLVALVALSLR
jgi:hypothetical protein